MKIALYKSFAIAIMSILLLPAIATAGPTPEDVIGQYVCIGLGNYSAPKWDPNTRVPGSIFLLQTKKPDKTISYYIAVYPQHKNKDDKWEDFTSRADQRYNGYIGRQGKVRDVIKIAGRDEASISLFVPNEALAVPDPKSPVRFQFRVFDDQTNHLQALDVSLPEMNTKTEKVQIWTITGVVAPDAVSKGPVLIYDITNKKYIGNQ